MTVVLDLEEWQIYTLIGVGGFLTYVVMAMITAVIFGKSGWGSGGKDDVEAACFCGLVWPASLPILIIGAVAYNLIWRPLYWTTEKLITKG